MNTLKSKPYESYWLAKQAILRDYTKIGNNKYLRNGTRDGAKAWIDGENRIVMSFG